MGNQICFFFSFPLLFLFPCVLILGVYTLENEKYVGWVGRGLGLKHVRSESFFGGVGFGLLVDPQVVGWRLLVDPQQYPPDPSGDVNLHPSPSVQK